jgi:spore germination protein KC
MLSPLTGCWDNRPLSDLSIVAGVGIDKSADGKFLVTVQILDKSGSQVSSSEYDSEKSTTGVVGAAGDTIFEAISNIVPRMGDTLYFTHVQLMVIGEDVAKEGLDHIWDYFERFHETGRIFSVLVVKNGTAKSVLEAKPGTERIGALQVAQASEQTIYGENAAILSFTVTELLSQPLTGIVTGVIDAAAGATSLKDMIVEGGAVFKHGKLIGYLDNDESRGFLFASDKIKNTILTIANPAEDGKLVSIEVIRSSCKLTAEIADGKPKLCINVTAAGNIGAEQGSIDLTDKDKIKSLESETEALITDNIRAMTGKSQKEFHCDILNFSDMLNKHEYSSFNNIKDNWEELYSDADISIKAEFSITKPGVIKKPAFSE